MRLQDVRTREDAREWLREHRESASRQDVHMLALQVGQDYVQEQVREICMHLHGDPGY